MNGLPGSLPPGTKVTVVENFIANNLQINYRVLSWGGADHLASGFCDFAKYLFTFAIGGGG